MILRVALFVILLCFTTGCGYHFGRGEILERYCTVCIPYVEGDDEGVFTAALIQEVNIQGCLAYRSCGADLLLKVCLLPPVDTNIGFIFATKNDEISHILTSNEARLMMVARISLIDRGTGQCILGPLEIQSSVEFDFEPDLSHIQKHAFALGQLEMHNLAQDAAFVPLFRILARKIVDYINNSW